MSYNLCTKKQHKLFYIDEGFVVLIDGNTIKRRVTLFVLVMAAFFVPNKTNAATSTNSFTVSASVVASCTIATTDISFGNYTLAQVDTTSTVTVTCTSGSVVKIGLNAGTGAGGTVTARKMTSGANTLNYGLYQDFDRTKNWGNTPGADTLNTTGNGTAQVFYVYGRIPEGQSAPIGTYTDTITATVNFS